MTSRSKAAKGHAVLRQVLLAKTGKTKQWLSSEVQRRKKSVPMEVRVAQGVVAHDNGVPIDRYLSGPEIAAVQQAIRDLLAKGGSPAAMVPANLRSLKPQRAAAGPAIKSSESDPFLAKEKETEAIEMSKVYPKLYVLENSIRAVIRGVMDVRFGADWWDTALTSANALKMKNKVEDRLKKEDDQSWHQRRGKHKIDYVDLGDLYTIAASKAEVFFPRLLGTNQWFLQLVEETSPTRNVVCHMNPLAGTSITVLDLRLKMWRQHLRSREAEIRAAMTVLVAEAS
jgi:hypothetical protein